MYLPRHVPPAFDAGASTVILSPATSQRETRATVLLVEQNTVVRDFADEVLRDLDHRVILSEDGAAALRRLAAGDAIDLIVTDVGLSGGLSGHDLAARAQALRPGLKVLFITGHADEAEVAASTMTSGVEVLPKPFKVATLVDRIGRLIGADTST